MTIPSPTAPTARQSFMAGLVHALPFLLVLIPFALLFGVVATTAGFNLVQTMGFSILVIAGASQFSAVQLMSDHAPVLIVLASSLAINLRMAMYSATLTPFIGKAPGWQRAAIAYVLTDQTFGQAIQQFEKFPDLSVANRVAYIAGLTPIICLPWIIFTYVGATAGSLIPAHWPLDFAVPITFLAMIAPMLKTLPHVVAATAAVAASLLLVGLPSGSNVLIAGPIGMIAGALTETFVSRKGRG